MFYASEMSLEQRTNACMKRWYTFKNYEDSKMTDCTSQGGRYTGLHYFKARKTAERMPCIPKWCPNDTQNLF